ncbi:MAG: HAD-IIB family hydrolase [Campylobacterota bacterium]|nr:HAD-IIB family hydrolase [Campylobacterota bacterium]
MNNIYITDLDHTFLRTDLSISPFTQKIWNVKTDNHILSVATARSFKKTEQFLKNLHVNAPMILLDGSLIVSEDKKIIDTKFITQDLGDAIIDEGAKLNIYPFVLALEDQNLNEAFLYPAQRNEYQHNLLKRYTKDDNLQERKEIRTMSDNFKLVYMGDESILKHLRDKLHSIFKNNLKYILAPEAYMGCYFLTLLHADADKAHGLNIVSDYLGRNLTDFTVFGDNLNDLGMFQLSGTSVAVSNAHDKLKKYADIVLPHTNDEDGVAKYLQSVGV